VSELYEANAFERLLYLLSAGLIPVILFKISLWSSSMEVGNETFSASADRLQLKTPTPTGLPFCFVSNEVRQGHLVSCSACLAQALPPGTALLLEYLGCKTQSAERWRGPSSQESELPRK